MTSHHAIVLATDGSDASKAAARWAAWEARVRECDIFVVHVCDVDSTSLWPTPSLNNELRECARPIVDSAIEVIHQAEPEVHVTGSVFLGSPSRILIDLSRRSDLIVLGRSGRGALAAHLVGSLNKRLAAHAKCPIVAVPVTPEATEHHVGKIVVGVGYHLTEERGARFAVTEARRRGATDVLAVRAWHGPNGLPVDPDTTPPPPMYSEDIERSALESRLAEKLDDLAETGPMPQVVVRAGQPGGLLASMCEPQDLLVVGQHQREQPFLPARAGRIVSDCLHQAPCPVAVVPDPLAVPNTESPRVVEPAGYLGY